MHRVSLVPSEISFRVLEDHCGPWSACLEHSLCMKLEVLRIPRRLGMLPGPCAFPCVPLSWLAVGARSPVQRRPRIEAISL